MVRDLRELGEAFSGRPEYLQDTEWGRDHPSFGDWGLQLSRSFRALKVWMSIQTFGMAAFHRAVAKGVELAERAEECVQLSDVLQIANPASLSVACFHVNPLGVDLYDERLEKLNDSVQARVIDTGMAMSRRPACEVCTPYASASSIITRRGRMCVGSSRRSSVSDWRL